MNVEMEDFDLDFDITDSARDKADRIYSIIMQGNEDDFLKMQLCYSLKLPDINRERGILNEVAKTYNEVINEVARESNKTASKEKKTPPNLLVAHGTQSVFSLCQILVDSKFKHLKDKLCYGALGSYSDNLLDTGYYDNGWGVFVAKSETAESAKLEGKYIAIPLEDLEGVLLPTPIVDVVRNEFPRNEFPEHAQILKGYLEFTDELKQRFRYRITIGKRCHEQFKKVLIDVSLYIGEEIKSDDEFNYKYYPIKRGVEEEIDQYIRKTIIQYLKHEFGERNSDGNKIYYLSYGGNIPRSLGVRLDKITAEE